jgi:H+-translocating NAD(P) transhydrogenase subunit alpha
MFAFFNKKHNMILGLLKESDNETRVALLPEVVKSLTDLKTEVIVEKSAGERSFINDSEYGEAGAKITSRDEVIKNADVLLRIYAPEEDDIKNLKSKQVWISSFDPLRQTDLVKTFLSKNVTSFSLDSVPRITRAQSMDILSSMATIAGYKAVLEAAMRLPVFFPMFMTAAGTIRPATVLVLGAGVAGLQAVATARRLGAQVYVFDVRSAVKEEVNSLGGKFVEVEGAKEEKEAGGYAVEQTEEYKKKQQEAINNHAVKSDVIICTAQIPGRKAPLLIYKETVERMKPGSIIVDLAASTGGNCELTKNDKKVVHKDITIIGQSNYPSQTQLDASRMFGKNVLNFLKLIIDEEGGLKLNFEDEIVRDTCITHNGDIYNERTKSQIEK